jgi:hypothetical protein
MGLDHGLLKRHYVKNWDHSDPKEKYQVTVRKGGKPVRSINAEKVEYIDEEVITWRKANQIHNWFVENVQDGEDNCQEHYVSGDQIRLLVADCEAVLRDSELIPGKVLTGISYAKGKAEKLYEDGKVIKDPAAAERLLPTKEGFFFGSTLYDQWYLDEVQRTAEVLREDLERTGDYIDYRYWSSW